MAKARALQRSFMAWACEVEPDKQGRILVPQSLREVAGLEKEIVVAGVSDRCEIWDKKRWDDFNSSIDDNELMEALEGLDFTEFNHIPVLLDECLEGLNIRPDGIYCDGTAGGAGHSREIAKRLDGEKGGRLVAIDRDPEAVKTATERLAGYPATVVRGNTLR